MVVVVVEVVVVVLFAAFTDAVPSSPRATSATTPSSSPSSSRARPRPRLPVPIVLPTTDEILQESQRPHRLASSSSSSRVVVVVSRRVGATTKPFDRTRAEVFCFILYGRMDAFSVV